VSEAYLRLVLGALERSSLELHEAIAAAGASKEKRLALLDGAPFLVEGVTVRSALYKQIEDTGAPPTLIHYAEGALEDSIRFDPSWQERAVHPLRRALRQLRAGAASQLRHKGRVDPEKQDEITHLEAIVNAPPLPLAYRLARTPIPYRRPTFGPRPGTRDAAHATPFGDHRTQLLCVMAELVPDLGITRASTVTSALLQLYAITSVDPTESMLERVRQTYQRYLRGSKPR